jgi:3-phosphoshikimate 1-carboxyvinyltransferase
MQRACAAALLTGGISTIQNPGISNDDEAALDIIRQFGAVITKDDNELVIDSTNSFLVANDDLQDDLQINCGESGLSIRMFTPIAALCRTPIRIVGSGSLSRRPMNFFDEILPKLGIKIQSQSGHIPIVVQGPLKPVNITIDGSLSSQFLTGLLMAYSAANASDVTIEVVDLKSKPYIDLTLSVMQSFGLLIPDNIDYERFYFPVKSNSKATQNVIYKVEGDWSGAAFLLVAGAIGSNISIKGLNINSTQADKKIMNALYDCGAAVDIDKDEIRIGKRELQAFVFDATDCPDLFPPLAALAAYCNGKSIIKGTHRLAHKESNRSITLQEQFGKLGVEILLSDDEMIINSTGKINGGIVHSCHDHRIAMACAVAAIGASSAVVIEDADAINKSYPEFYQHLKQLHVDLKNFDD